MISWAELLAMTVQDLERAPRRTVLTILGLVIGSAAVVAVSSVGLAGRDYALKQLESLGTNFIWVSYGGPSDSHSSGREINEDDFLHIQNEATAVAVATRVVVLYTTISSGGKQSSNQRASSTSQGIGGWLSARISSMRAAGSKPRPCSW